jgi:hypothetical protein
VKEERQKYKRKKKIERNKEVMKREKKKARIATNDN